MTLNARRKGVRFDRRTVAGYKAIGCDATRAPSILESQGGVTGVDVRASVGRLRLAIQCRAQARPSVFAALEDAQHGALAGEIAVAHVRRTNGPWPTPSTDIVVIAEADWIDLMRLVAASRP